MYYQEAALYCYEAAREVTQSNHTLNKIAALGDKMTGDDYQVGFEVTQYVAEFRRAKDHYMNFLMKGI